MKKVLLLSAILVLLNLCSKATTHVITVSNFQFSPSNLTVFVGDVVRFQWSNGNHTTTCDPSIDNNTSLPAGATPWDQNIRSSTPTFDYPVTVAGTYKYNCQPHAPNMAGTFVAQTLVPLKLSYFNLESANEGAKLIWKTATEQNTDHFSIKRSIDGSDYTEIATVAASGNSSSEKNYSFSDNKIINTQKFYYYTITTIDKDGRQLISEAKLFKNPRAVTKLVLTLSPNPISSPGHLNMTFNSEKEGKMMVRIVNAEGKTIVNRNMQAYIGINKGHIHLGDQSAGTYTVVCTMDGVSESYQVVYK